tara:strand:+ start:342 stop:761 length:420 start_codon:yes stop_codon:yes gene_type:complete
MSWRDILKRDSLRDWFNNPSKRDKKRKKAFKPRSAYYMGSAQKQRYARNKWQGEKPTSRYIPESEAYTLYAGPKPASTPKPKPTPKPKRQIPARTVVDNYFEMYRNQGKGKPTLNDIKREEGRPLTVNEEEAYYRRMRA